MYFGQPAQSSPRWRKAQPKSSRLPKLRKRWRFTHRHPMCSSQANAMACASGRILPAALISIWATRQGNSRPPLLAASASFLNLKATADFLQAHPAKQVLLVCSGTGEVPAYEDVLGAGALASALWPDSDRLVADSAAVARQIYERHQDD